MELDSVDAWKWNKEMIIWMFHCVTLDNIRMLYINHYNVLSYVELDAHDSTAKPH